jgi:hypothetical protein
LEDGLKVQEGGMATPEPGLDRHEWESERASLDPELRDSPREALPELADLVQRMLGERGFELEDPTTLEGEEREIVEAYRAARETADRIERDEDVDPGDVADAVNSLQGVFDTVVAERSAP